METKTKLLTLLAVLCVIFSACAVSAVDYNNGYYEVDYDDGYYEVDYDDGPYDDIYDDDYYEYHAAQSQPAATNTTSHAAAGNAPVANATGNATSHAAGGNASVANATGNATSHAAGGNASVANQMPVTGLPILALLGVGAVLGGAALYKRK